MSSMLNDPYLIQRSIFTFFAAKMPRDDILAYLLRAHEHQPNFFPRVDYRDVDFWLKSFKEGNFDLEQVPSYAENATLVNLPVIESIIHMGNIKEQTSLRGTCRIFEDFIDGEERLLKRVHIGIDQNAITLKILSSKQHDAVYRRKGTECEITKDGETIQSKTDFITSAFEDFKQAIQHVNIKINLMVISCVKSVDEEHQNIFYCSVVSILSSLKFKIHVEKLELSVWTPDQVLSILSEIDQSNFTSLNITCNDREKGLVMDDIIVQPFWSNLKFFSLQGCTVFLKLESIQHIPDVSVSLSNDFTDEEMKSYRDNILKQPNFESHGLRCASSDVDGDVIRWKQAMKPFTPVLNEFGEERPSSGKLMENGKIIRFDFFTTLLVFSME
ncbi:unnamed protein product [Caenorhabditis brenneri]